MFVSEGFYSQSQNLETGWAKAVFYPEFPTVTLGDGLLTQEVSWLNLFWLKHGSGGCLFAAKQKATSKTAPSPVGAGLSK